MKQLGFLCLFSLITLILNAQIKAESFDFEFEDVFLNGVLNLPESDTIKGIVLLIHGSGRTNAVEQYLHYDVREQLVKSGYVTYMWDKMGCGKSGGTFDYNQSVQSSASEAIAAIEALKAEQIPGSNAIGLWGISRAGWINPLIINQYPGIKFWISVSGVDDQENFKYLLQQNLRIDGQAEDSIRLLVNEWQRGVELTHQGESYEDYLAATINLRDNPFIQRFMNGGGSAAGYYSYQQSFMQEELDEDSGLQVYIPGFADILSNVHCPVLALFGAKDQNIDWTKTITLYGSTLGKNTSLSIQSFPGCNHNLFQCKTGGFYEFEDDDLPWIRCEGFLPAMEKWLKGVDSY